MINRENNNTADVYHPLPHSRKLHLSEEEEVYLIGGYGCGKTTALVEEALRLAAINAGLCGMLTAPTYRMVRDILLPAMSEALRRHRLAHKIKLTDLSIELPRHTIILLRSRDNPKRLLGHNLAWAGSDEITLDRHDEAHRAIISRVRHPLARRSRIFGVGTPEGFN
jgi:phage terminase large subunit-like protein